MSELDLLHKNYSQNLDFTYIFFSNISNDNKFSNKLQIYKFLSQLSFFSVSVSSTIFQFNTFRTKNFT